MAETGERGPSALRLIARDRALLLVLAAAVALSFVYHQSTVTLALEVDARGLSTDTYGLLASLNGMRNYHTGFTPDLTMTPDHGPNKQILYMKWDGTQFNQATPFGPW